MPVRYRIVSDKKLNRKNTRTRAHLKANDRIGSSRELQHHFPTKGVQQHGISTDFGREIKRRCISGHAVFCEEEGLRPDQLRSQCGLRLTTSTFRQRFRCGHLSQPSTLLQTGNHYQINAEMRRAEMTWALPGACNENAVRAIHSSNQDSPPAAVPLLRLRVRLVAWN